MAKRPDVIILCGGAGLRLRDVIGNLPKGMAELAGRPFLEILLRQLRRHGFERVVLAVGYQKDAILSHFGASAFGLSVVYSPEARPLGTGGALRNAAALVNSESVLVMNGDSYTDADLVEFVAHHDAVPASVSLVVVPVEGRNDCGSVEVGERGAVLRFAEKEHGSSNAFLNAGIYMMPRRLLWEIPGEREVSLERELFPRWLAERMPINAFRCNAPCVDIGTPDRYRLAQDSLAATESL